MNPSLVGKKKSPQNLILALQDHHPSFVDEMTRKKSILFAFPHGTVKTSVEIEKHF
jgi:hypothetical protein